MARLSVAKQHTQTHGAGQTRSANGHGPIAAAVQELWIAARDWHKAQEAAS